ncbi:Uncharacterised protein [Vibrio cholerae]|nr:Uncharacterised protein [Vibrio cholerae]
MGIMIRKTRENTAIRGPTTITWVISQLCTWMRKAKQINPFWHPASKWQR